MLAELKQKIEQHESLIGVIGLGYVGLPLISAFHSKGFPVLGFDVDPAKVDALNEGRSYIKHIDDEQVTEWRRSGRFEATSDTTRLSEPDVLLICVPTPLNNSRDPDLTYVEQTTASIAKVLRKGQLVILESTTYPTTTRDVMKPILEANGMVAGEDFYLAYSPEREDPGNPDYTAAVFPKWLAEMIREVWNWPTPCIPSPSYKLFLFQVVKSPKPVKFLKIRIVR